MPEALSKGLRQSCLYGKGTIENYRCDDYIQIVMKTNLLQTP